MNHIVNEDFSIINREFKINGKTYEIVGSRANGSLKETIDLVKHGKEYFEYTRLKLYKVTR